MDAFRKAFNTCHPQLRDINAAAIIPHLNAKGLLAPVDLSILNGMPTNHQKNDEIIRILPKKGKGWWDKFLDCLRETAVGNPQHADLIKYLKDALKGI